MSDSVFSTPECRPTLEQMDAYIDNVLPADQTRQVTVHLSGCAACAEELESRKALRQRVRGAALAVPGAPYLESRVRARLRETPKHSNWINRLMLAGAMAVLVIGIGAAVAYRSGYMRITGSAQESYIALVSSRVPALMRVGLGDHIHCTVYRTYPKNPPPATEFVRLLGPDYSALIPVVQQNVPSNFRLIMAHQCRYQSRRFVHLTMTNGTKLVSLVIARKGDGESFHAQDLLPALSDSGLPIYRAGVQRFQMAAFETRDRLVYIISDLPEGRNTELMRAMAPGIRGVLAKLES